MTQEWPHVSRLSESQSGMLIKRGNSLREIRFREVAWIMLLMVGAMIKNPLRFRVKWTAISVWMGVLLSSGPYVFAQDPALSDPTGELLMLIRRSCFDQKELWGIRAQSCDLLEGGVTLDVLLEDEKQKEPLVETVRNIIRDMPELKEWRSADVKITSFTVIRFRSELLPKLQSLMAKNDLPDVRTRNLLRRTRLDNARFDYDGGVVFDATCIDEGALKENSLVTKPADCAENRLIIELEEYLSSLLGSDTLEKWRLFNNKIQLRAVTSPVLEWKQRAITDEALDAIELKDAFYDEHGKLSIAGSVQTMDQKEKLFESFRSFFASAPVCRDLQEAQEAIDRLETSSFGTYVAMLRQKFSEIDSPVARSTWLRRIYYVSPGQAAVEAETFSTTANSVDDPTKSILLKLLRSSHDAISDADLRRLVSGFENVTIKSLPSPATLVQTAISARDDLDGSLIDSVAFDSKGRLIFGGRSDTAEQVADLRYLVMECLRAEKHPWAQMELDLVMSHESTRELLNILRSASSAWDELRIDRLWFADGGQLKVKGEIAEGQPTADVGKSFRELTIKHFREPRMKRLAEDLELDITSTRPSMLKFLRTLVSRGESLEGVCLARGYYDVESRFVLEVVLDREEQIESVRELLKTAADSDVWKHNLPNGCADVSARTIPMAPRIERLRAAMSAYEEFDGIDIESAYHDGENRLSFRGSIACGKLDAERRILSAHETG